MRSCGKRCTRSCAAHRSPLGAGDSQAAALAERLAQVCAALAALARASARIAPETSARASPETHPRVAAGESLREPLPEQLLGPEEISIRDARGEGPAAWVRAVGSRLECHARDARPFAVLLVEVTDAQWLAEEAPAAEVARLLARVQSALQRALRRDDDATLESPGRW
ncbi:MAG TPA: hypothetical protein VL977_03180 [Solirubrobacteraceae bacterium]|nr:hypothetical protein [Solirubrobacteraceae bacterium]